MRRTSERGFTGLLLLLLLCGGAVLFYMYGVPGQNTKQKSPFEIQMEAVQKAKGVQDLSDKRNQEIEAAIED